MEALRRTLRVEPGIDATIRSWIVEAPWAHPMWHSYVIIVIHLRPMPGIKTLFYVNNATHEIHLYALDPLVFRTGLIKGDVTYYPYCLTPINFAAQMVEKDDAAAVDKAFAAVRDICEGKLNPDTDARASWIERFGGNMVRK